MCLALSIEVKAEEQRLRITETSVTETGSIEDSDLNLKTIGYGITYVHATGLGVSYTFLKTTDDEPAQSNKENVTLNHNYVDISMTLGELSSFLFILGGGIGVSGSAEIKQNSVTRESSSFQGRSAFIALGYTFENFEIGWLHRYSQTLYAFDDRSDLKANLDSYFLVLGIIF